MKMLSEKKIFKKKNIFMTNGFEIKALQCNVVENYSSILLPSNHLPTIIWNVRTYELRTTVRRTLLVFHLAHLEVATIILILVCISGCYSMSNSSL